jgi:hypothetical protein
MRGWNLGTHAAAALCIAAALLGAPARARAHGSAHGPAHGSAGEHATEPASARWSEGYTFVELAPGADLDAARELVQARGGTVALLLPPSTLTGWIPPDSDASLLGHAGIRRLYRAHDVAEAGMEKTTAAALDPASRAARRFFERAVRGELDETAASEAPAEAAGESADPASGPRRMLHDARERGEISELDIAANLARMRIAPTAKSGGDLHLAANSDYMTGTVAVTLFFVESDGSGADPDRYSWSTAREQDVFDDAAAALSWWVSQARRYTGCWVVFRLEPRFATEDARCAQWREPLLHPSTDFQFVVQDILAHFGFTHGGHMSRAAAYDAALRLENDTDWAYCAFVAANPSGPTQLPDGYAAWAYLGGPYLVALENSFGWSFKQVFAHESGHIFRACDEYYDEGYGGCTSCGPCGDTGVPNGNCEQCNSGAVSCMMRSNSWALCNYTAGQIGWWRTPCTEHTIPAPRLDVVLPSQAVQGIEAEVTLQGDFFAEGSAVSFGDGVDVLTLTRTAETEFVAQVRIGLEAAAGPRDVRVTGPDGQWDLLTGGFAVRATPRHYVSTSGAGVFPFDAPDQAATSLEAALDACSTGDTLLVAAGVYAPLAIDRSVVILGGWSPDFGIRLPASQPSVIAGTSSGPALRISGASAAPVVDGFRLHGGAGELIATPDLGSILAGGGLLVIDASPILRQCIVEGNAAGTPGTPGAGGGAFFWRAHVTLESCNVQANRASQGAGLYFLQSEALVVDTRIESNDTGGGGRGGGIAARESDLEFQGGAVRRNRGAQDGGGIDLESCSSFVATGLACEENSATRQGGGIASRATPVLMTASRITGNQAGEYGGGVQASDGSIEFESSLCAANQAGSLGGGLHLARCLAALENITVARNTGGPASGIYLADAPDGSRLRGCIVAENTLGGAAFSGGVPPVADWNLYFANGGLDRLGMPAGANDLVAEPGFVASETLDFRLALRSPALDSGDPDAARADPDGTRNDRGAHGGPFAAPAQTPCIRGLAGTQTAGGIRLDWNPGRDPAIVHYVIYRGTTSSVAPLLADSLGTVAVPTTSYLDPAPPGGAYYAVVAVDLAGAASGILHSIQASPPSDATDRLPSFALERISPNPANPGAWIEFELPATLDVQLAVFDARGRHVRSLASGTRNPVSCRKRLPRGSPVPWSG